MHISSPSRLSVLTISVISALMTQSVQAANADSPSITLQTIRITANRSVYDKVQQDAIYSDEYTPAQQASHLSDFLEAVPGVSIGGSSALNQRIRVRGLDDTNVKVTIDGARQEGALFYHMGDVTIDPDLLKRTEVAVGNNSVTLGNDALGGAVAFETVDAADLLKPGQQVGAKLHVGFADNNDELLTSATVYAAPNDNVDLLAYYGKRDANAGEDGDGRKFLTKDSKGENILLKAGVNFAEAHRIGATYSSTENKGRFPLRPDFPGSEGVGSWNEVLPQKVKRDTYSLNYNFNPANELVNIDADVYQTKTKISRDTDYTVQPGYDWIAEVKTTGAKVQNTSVINNGLGTHRLITGVEHYKKESEMARNTRKTGSDEAKNTSVFLEDQWQINKLTLTPGVRYDRYESPKYVAGGKKYNNVVGALSASYEIAPSTYVFASYTELFNGPDLSQTIFNTDGDLTYVNRNLKPEEGDNTEVGVTTTLRNLTTTNDALQLNAKYFKTNIENYLQFIRTGDRAGRYGLDCTTGVQGSPNNLQSCQGMTNSDEDFEIKGVELSANYRTNNFGMGLSYARARSEGKKTGYNMGQVSGSSSDSGDRYMLNLNYEPNDELALGWRSTYVDSIKPKTASNDPKKPRYDVHDVFMSYTPRQVDGLKATLGVYNLFDETYANHASRLDPTRDDRTDFEPGRNFKASLTYQF